MKLSVIVCLYNTKKEYFEACLKSIRESSLKKEEYELIVIDDGSHEKYDEIIEKYDPVFVKTSNRGLLSARLFGVAIAKGEYVTFCDADDTVSFNYHAPMLKKAYLENADIVINDWAFDTEYTKYACGEDTTIKETISYQNEDILKFFASGKGRMHSYFVQWNKIFKKDLLLSAKKEIEKTGAFSNKPFTYSEDALSNFFAMKNAKKLVNIHSGYYFYRVHDNQTVNTSGRGSFIKEIEQMALTFDIMLNNLPNNQNTDEIKENILSWRAYMARKHYSYAKHNGFETLFDFIKEKYNQEILEESYAKDSYAYIGDILLGENLAQIDKELYRVFKANGDINVIYDQGDAYVSEAIEYIKEETKVNITNSSNKLVVIPKRKISLRSKVLHNKLIAKIGISLFKKGSKLRAKIKSKL